MGSFADKVQERTRVYEKRLRATARQSVQETVLMAQKPVRAGGRMRIKTGFLRASIQAALHQMPAGPSSNDGDRTFTGDQQVAGEPVAAVLLRWNPATTSIFVGWTANYARVREFRDGFMRGATEMWPETVARVARQVRARI